jgi:glycosyltransferase involved in cell wall biosynthesis
MKILHLNTFDHGGAAIAAIRLHKALLSQGIQSSMLFINLTNHNIPSAHSFVYPVHRRPSLIKRQFIRLVNKIRPRLTLQEYNNLKLKNRVDGYEMFSFNPVDLDVTTQRLWMDADIIHLHYIAGFVDYRIFEKTDKPIIWTLHDMNPFTGGCHYSSGCEKYKSECIVCPQLEGTINTNNALEDQNYKMKYLSNISPIITAPSIWLKNCSSESRLFKHFQNIHIPYSLDLSVFKLHNKVFCRQVLNLPENKRVLLFVSYQLDNYRKGFDLLINALSRITHSDVHLCVIGSSYKELESQENVSFLGRIYDDRTMALAYSAADAFVMPSREDNLPNVMLESLACGTPLIAFPIGGVVDVVKTGFNGLLAKNLTSESLYAAINEFLESKNNFDPEIISQNIRDTYSPQIQALRYLTLYSKMLNLEVS